VGNVRSLRLRRGPGAHEGAGAGRSIALLSFCTHGQANLAAPEANRSASRRAASIGSDSRGEDEGEDEEEEEEDEEDEEEAEAAGKVVTLGMRIRGSIEGQVCCV